MDGSEEIVDVLPGWVLDNFHHDALATLCKVFLQNKDGKELIYMSVDDQNVNLPIDKQFYKIRYHKNGKFTHYFGLIKGNKTPQKISCADANNWFSKAFLKEVKNLAKSGKTFYEIPVGNNDALQLIMPEFPENAPKIKYRQERGERTCLITSICNTLHFLNLPKWAEAIWSDKEVVLKIEDQTRRWNALHDIVWKVTKILKPQKIKIAEEESKYRPEYHTDDLPLICALEGSDGKTDHVIGLANGYIFDGSFEYAILNTKENLDICCSSETERSEFKQIHYGVLYAEHPKKEKKFMDKYRGYLFE